MKRFYDWPERLASVVDARLSMPFEWGQQDCCSFAAACVVAMTGEDPMEDVRAEYRDEREAARLLLSLGGIEKAVDERLVRVPVACAQRGDVLLFDLDGRATLAVCVGENAFGPGATGLVRLDTLAARVAWMVGRDG